MHINYSVVKKVFIFLITVQGSLCLRNVELMVPVSVQRGSRVEMKCVYDLEQEVLYTVKWYRGDREFCRYSPRDVPPLKIFRIPGIEVEKEATDAQKLTMHATTRTANGRYTCEVSADAPSFQTARVHAHMNVVDFPNPEPEVLGVKLYYRVGSHLKVECTSLNSMPAANLSFFINSKRVHHEHVWHRVSPTNDSLWNAYSTLQFVVQKHHFIRGKMKVRCNVNIYNIYFRSNELCALEERIPTTPDPSLEKFAIYPIHRIADNNKKQTDKKNCADSYHGTGFSVFLLTLWYTACLTNIN